MARSILVLLAVFVLVLAIQAYLAQRKPELKTIATVVAHAHHHHVALQRHIRGV
jgi:hypothetical protein